MTAHSSIPIVDIGSLATTDEAARFAVANKLCKAAAMPGFFYVKGHGIPQKELDEVFAVARRFFAAPVEQKRSVAISQHHRGWLEVGAAKMYGSDNADHKESFVWGLDIPDDDPDFIAGDRLLAPNQWPAYMPEMCTLLNDYFSIMQVCGQQILQAFAIGLGIESDYFMSDFDKPVSRGALIYYPQRPKNVKAYGVAPHSDYGTLTLLAQDDTGGLQVRTKSQEWIDVEPIAGTFVVNIGDLLSRWSNGRFESTPHRVINPEGRERYSVGMFVDPNWDSMVEPVALAGEAALHAPVRCADYINERYDEAFAYRNMETTG